MPPINGMLETALYVDDPEKSAQFYHRIFGFIPFSSGERLTAMRIADKQVLLLFKKGLSSQLPTLPHDGTGRLHLAFAIDAKQLEAWQQWLIDCGVKVEERKKWERGGTSLYFRDPDGHLVEVATPGVWSIY